MLKAIYTGIHDVDFDGDKYDIIKCPHCGVEQRDYGNLYTTCCYNCSKLILLERRNNEK